MEKDSFCSYCGHGIAGSYPKACPECGQITYQNPLVVAVAVVPSCDGILVVRRAIAPYIGGYAMPGGYQNIGETPEEAAARECLEETGVTVHASEASYFGSAVAGTNTLMFYLFPPTRQVFFEPGPETLDVTVALEGDRLCFPLHQSVMDRYLGSVERA